MNGESDLGVGLEHEDIAEESISESKKDDGEKVENVML